MLIASKCLTNVYSFLISTCKHVRDCVLFKKLCKEAVVTRQGPRRLQDEVLNSAENIFASVQIKIYECGWRRPRSVLISC